MLRLMQLLAVVSVLSCAPPMEKSAEEQVPVHILFSLDEPSVTILQDIAGDVTLSFDLQPSGVISAFTDRPYRFHFEVTPVDFVESWRIFCNRQS